jgi:CTP:molybdopterin cytidylyltransferase MocA
LALFLVFFANDVLDMELKIFNIGFPLILLAGGRSSRMGIPKGLVDYHGHPWLKEQLKRFKSASGRRAVIVLGFHLERYFKQIPWLKKATYKPVQQLGLEISTVINPTPEQGQFSSLKCAIALLSAPRLSPSPQPSPSRLSSSQASRGEGERFPSSFLEDRGGGGAFILPIDVPCPGKEAFENLTAAFHDSIDAVIPQYQSKGGHPVLLSAGFLQRLTEVPHSSPDARLDLQIQALPVKRITFVPVENKNILLNMNSLAEFQGYSNK